MRSATRFVPVLAAAAVFAVALGGCAGSPPAPAPTSASATPTPTPTPVPTVDPLAGMTLEQRVGQLFMVGTALDDPNPTVLDAIGEGRLGGVFLHGRSDAGVEATAQLVAHFTAALPAGSPRLWVSADQEGGQVQTLSGPGFDDIPSALVQGGHSPTTLQSDARTWAGQLLAAGVNVDLAPVADIVTSPQSAQSNPPIGELDREYGYDEQSVLASAGAFAAGMRSGGVMPTFKHFPGLGHVGDNTDTASGVTDDVVTQDGPDVDVYRRLLAQGPAVVMLSTAIYAKIDPTAPAAFSSTVATTLLRNGLGFTGVVTTDDLSAAAQVEQWSPADRATLAISAGVDLVLISNTPSLYPEMFDAVVAKAQSDPAFAARVNAAARRVVSVKSAAL